MQSVGIINELVPNLVLGYGSEYVSPGGRPFLKVKPKTLEYGYPRRNAFWQPVLEGMLRANLDPRPGGGKSTHEHTLTGTTQPAKCGITAEANSSWFFAAIQCGQNVRGTY